MPVDPDYMPNLDKEFRKWLDEVYPEWDYEYSGRINDMEEAWFAGRKSVLDAVRK